VVFWDTSALVKAYSPEAGSSTVLSVIGALPYRTSVSAFVALETLSVFAKLLRTNTFSASEYQTARTQFYGDYPRRFVNIPVKRQIRLHALTLAETHRMAGIGALDVLHLACALYVRAATHPKPAVLAVVDGPLRRIATQEGLRTFNPETQSVSDLLSALR
jgi:predicted nucleic acid-binding protein